MSASIHPSDSLASPPPPPTEPAPSPAHVAAGWMSHIPAVVVMALLGGLAWYGHHTGWKLSSGALFGQSTSTAGEEFCQEHNVPESICVECQPDLLPGQKDFGWCKEHGVPECPLCHPEIAQLKTVPEITAEQRQRAAAALAFSERSENSRQCALHKKHVQFASQAAVEKAGIDIAPVWESPIVESVSAGGEIGYDETRLAHLASPVGGILWRADKRAGDRVRKGELLALIDSADVGRAKSAFLQALAQTQFRKTVLDGMRPTFDRGALAEAKFREAEASLREAAIQLTSAEQTLVNLGIPVRATDYRSMSPEQLGRLVQFLGLPEALAATLDPATTSGNLFPLKAPLDGTIVTRHGVIGEVVDASQVLFMVADLSRLWLSLELRMEDARQVQFGQTVRFIPDGSTREVSGSVSWISTSVDKKTRTVEVRAELDNADGTLRTGTFGRGRIILREEPKAIVVPNESVQWDGDCHVVFVRDRNFLKKDTPKVFHVRKVRIGARDERNTEIIAGVLPGEIVSTTGSATLRAQLLKSNLGEGCGCHH